MLSDQVDMNEVIVEYKGPVKGVILNHDDHAYA